MKRDNVTLAPELWNELAPFSLIFDRGGKVTSMAERVGEVWLVDTSKEESVAKVNAELTLIRPFEGAFDPKWIPDLTDLIIHLALSSHPKRVLRGQLYPHGEGWLFTGFPVVSTISELEEMGMQLSRLPLQTALGERLIANESSMASFHESQIKAEQLKAANDNLQETLQRFSRFVPATFLEDIGIESPLDATLGGHVETHKAVMFADLRGFTTISEQLEASQIFEIINQYLGCTVPCIEAHGGYVLQYLGDGILALFPSHSVAALNAAVDMQKALRSWQEEHSGLPHRLRMSIGIHEGPVALGIVGNENRWDASIIADAVNTSARIEAMTRVLGGDVMVSRQFLDSAGDISGFELRELGIQQIRGRKGLLPLVEILDSLDAAELASRRLTSAEFNRGIEAYRNGDMYLAMSCFSQVLSRVPSDLAAQYYLARISQRLSSIPS
jgi:class 3 adenylate cyclase